MRPQALMILLAFGFLAVAASGTAATAGSASGTIATTAQTDTSMARADTTAAPADTTAARADSTAVPPAVVAPAVVAPAAAAPAAVTPAPAATPAPAPTAPATASKKAPNDRIYYGGTVTLSFGSPTRLGIYPMIGYKLTPKISGGVEAGYEHLSYDGGQSTHDYGGSVFGRYRVGRNLYAHAEYQFTNYEIFTTPQSSSREWVPALLLGGGYVRAIGPRMSVYAEALFDVLQDPNSPYGDWEPVVSFGVAAGF
jgi:hypothetical protein